MNLRSLCLAIFAITAVFVSAALRGGNPLVAMARFSGSEEQASKAAPPKPTKLPAEIVLILSLEEMPGLDNPKSFWEGAYEIRVADWQALTAEPQLVDAPDFGESLIQSSFAKRSVLAEDNRHVTISVPVSGRVSERLKAQASNPQVFLLRSTIRLFDAQLDRQYALKVNRLWQFKLFPDGRATVNIKIEPDGSYSTYGPVPKVLPPGYSIVGVPTNQIPAKTP